MAAEKAFHDARIQYHENFRLLKESAITPTVMSAARLLTESGMRAQGTAFDPQTEKMEVVKIPTSGAVVRHMVTDIPRKRIWLALSGTGRIGKIELK